MERAAYVFCDSFDKQKCLFLFQNLTDSMMKRALPCHADGTGNYYIAIYREGKDYLGRTDYAGIEKLMKDEKMFPLFNTKYEDIRDGLNCEFTEDEYTKYQTFAEMHIKGFIDLAKKYCNHDIFDDTSETKGDDIPPSETKGDDIPPSETKGG